MQSLWNEFVSELICDSFYCYNAYTDISLKCQEREREEMHNLIVSKKTD